MLNQQILMTENEIIIFVSRCCQYAQMGNKRKLRSVSVTKKWKAVAYSNHSHVICTYAISAGHLNTLRWCVKNGCVLTPNEMFVAVLSGDIKIVKWLIKKNCPTSTNPGKLILHPFVDNLFQENYCNLVAWSGEKEMIEFLYKFGMRWTAEAYKFAINNPDENVLMFMVKIDTNIFGDKSNDNSVNTTGDAPLADIARSTFIRFEARKRSCENDSSSEE